MLFVQFSTHAADDKCEEKREWQSGYVGVYVLQQPWPVAFWKVRYKGLLSGEELAQANGFCFFQVHKEEPQHGHRESAYK